jgi:O-antigen ligase
MIATPGNGQSDTWASPAPTALQGLAFGCFWLFNVAVYSRVLDLKFYSLHLPLILGTIATLGVVLGGGLGRTLRSKFGMLIIALTGLYAATVPYSVWRSGSLDVLRVEWAKSVLVFLIAGSVVMTLRQCRWAMYSVAVGAALATVLVGWKGTVIDNRLVLAQGSYANPNEFAFGLLQGLPGLGLMFTDFRAGTVRRFLAGAAIVGAVAVLLRTGSRGGLIGLAVVGFCVFWKVSLPRKVLLVLAVGVLVALAGALLPEVLARRYATIFSDAEATSGDPLKASDAAALGGALGSSHARRALFLRSLKVTLEHPLMGCGIGQFGIYTGGVDTQAGRLASWSGTHNTYTQVSAEAGIPAFIVYMALLTGCFRSVGACYRRAVRIGTARARDIAHVAYALRTSLWTYAIATVFTFVAYSPWLPFLAGITVAFLAAAQPELALAEREMAEAGAVSVPRVVPGREGKRAVY